MGLILSTRPAALKSARPCQVFLSRPKHIKGDRSSLHLPSHTDIQEEDNIKFLIIRHDVEGKNTIYCTFA